MANLDIETLGEMLVMIKRKIREVSGLTGVKAYAIPDSPYQIAEIQVLVELYYQVKGLILTEELSFSQYIAWANEEDRLADEKEKKRTKV